MKRVTILFKSGNKLSFICKSFEIDFDGLDNRTLKMIEPNINNWMFNLSEIEAYIVEEKQESFFKKWFKL